MTGRGALLSTLFGVEIVMARAQISRVLAISTISTHFLKVNIYVPLVLLLLGSKELVSLHDGITPLKMDEAASQQKTGIGTDGHGFKSLAASDKQRDPETPAERDVPPPFVSQSSVLEDDMTLSNAPKMSLFRLFGYSFYNFGMFAWGGPVAQIALLKEQDRRKKKKWISVARFQRVFAVYQILPGPEAAELCMFFGCLSAGRLGGLVAGLGFILPGFMLMLLASYLYNLAGLENKYFNASFRALQPIVAAMVSAGSTLVLRRNIVDERLDFQSMAQNSGPLCRQK